MGRFIDSKKFISLKAMIKVNRIRKRRYFYRKRPVLRIKRYNRKVGDLRANPESPIQRKKRHIMTSYLILSSRQLMVNFKNARI